MEKMKFNDMTREFIEDFISKLPKEDKEKIKEYIKNNPRSTSSGLFTLVKSYIYNTYFKMTPIVDKKKSTFASVIDDLLNDDEDE